MCKKICTMCHKVVDAGKALGSKIVNGAQTLALTAASAAALALGMPSTDAIAALPAAVATTFTAIETDATDIFALAFPVVGAVLGLVIVIKLFKRFTGKI